MKSTGEADDRIASLMQAVVIVLLLASPLFNISEILNVLSGLSVRLNISATPAWLKLAKDAGLLLIGLLAGVLTMRRMHAAQRRTLIPVAVLGVVIALSAAVTFFGAARDLDERLLMVASGARWALPWALAWLMVGKVDAAFMRRVALVVGALFLASFTFQVFQAFHTSPATGFNAAGLPRRVSGMFLVANTASFFACLAALLSYFYLRGSPLRWPVILLAPLSVWFTASGTGFIALGAMLLLIPFGTRLLSARLLVLPILLLATYVNLEALTTRVDLLQNSGGGRARIFLNAVQEAGVVSDQFGTGTNTGVLLRSINVDTQSEITDSFYASVVVNTGYAGLMLLIVFVVWAWALAYRYSRRTGDTEPVAVAALYTVFGAATSITEAFPMNLVLVVWIGWFAPKLLAPALVPAVRTAAPAGRGRWLGWTYAAIIAALLAALLAPEVAYEVQLARVRAMIPGLTTDVPQPVFKARADEALATLASAMTFLPQRPNAPDLMTDVAHRYANRGDWVSALDIVFDARHLAPRQSRIMLSAVNLYGRLDAALRADPTLLPALREAGLGYYDFIELGMFAASAGHDEAALQWLESARGFPLPHPAMARDLWLRLGAAYLGAGRYDAAVQAVEAARALPAGPAANDGLGRAMPTNAGYAVLQDVFTADACWNQGRVERVYDAMRQDPAYVARAGDFAWLRGRWADAAQCYALNERLLDALDAPGPSDDVAARARAAALMAAAEPSTKTSDPALQGPRLIGIGSGTTVLQSADLTYQPPPAAFASFGSTAIAKALSARTEPFANSASWVALARADQDSEVLIRAAVRDPAAAARVSVGVDAAAAPAPRVEPQPDGTAIVMAPARLAPGVHLIGAHVAGTDSGSDNPVLWLSVERIR